MHSTLAFLTNGLGTWDMIILLVLGLLLFGRRLPEVGRSLGKGIVEFKKGLSGVEDEVNAAVRKSEQQSSQLPPPSAPRRLDPPVTPAGADMRVSRADVVD